MKKREKGKTKRSKILLLCTLVMCMTFLLGMAVQAEEGDSFTEAKEIYTDVAYRDNIEDKWDQNFYQFTLSQAGLVDFTFKHENLFDDEEYWTLYLFDSQTNEISAYFFSGEGGSAQTGQVGLSSGTYYIRIRGGDWYSNYSHCYSDTIYSFMVNVTQTDFCERENNESFQEATTIKTGYAYKGSIKNGGDVDYYKFTLPKSGIINFSIAHPNYQNTENYYICTLFAPDTAYIAESYSSGVQTSASSPSIGLAAGTYYIKITGGNWYSSSSHRYSTETYSLQVKYNATEYCEKENNNNYDTATKMTINNSYKGSVSQRDDTDFYRVEVANAGTYVVDFSHAKINDKEEYYTVAVIDSDTNVVKEISISGTDNTTSTDVTLKSGYYYIKVRGGNWYSDSSHRYSTGDYNIKLGYQLLTPKLSFASSSVTKAYGAPSFVNRLSATTDGAITYSSSNTKVAVVNGFGEVTIKAVGKAVITAKAAKGKKYSAGSKSYSLTVLPSTPKIKSLQKGSKKLTVKWEKKTVSGYEIAYSTAGSFPKSKTKNVVIKKGSVTSYKLTGLKAKTKYYVRIRTYKTISGKKYYSNWSGVKNAVTKK